MSIGSRLFSILYTKPMKFQVQGIRFAEKQKGRAIIGDDMGLGKTLQAIGWSILHPEVSPIIIVCPATVKEHWQRQFKKHAGLDSKIMEGKIPHIPSQSIIIINYDILNNWVNLLKKIAPKLLIIDECHYIKNQKTLRTKACKKLSKICPHILALSGTPITNRPVEFFPILQIIAPKEFSSFWTYTFRYCDPKPGWRGRGWDFNGASHLEELHKKVSQIMIRRLKKDVLKDLPPKIRTTIPVQITNKKEYLKAEDNFLTWLENNNGKEAAKKASGAIQLVRLGALKRLAAEGKLKIAFQWIKDFLKESEEKLIIFTVHKSIITKLKEKHPTAAWIDGSIPSSKRQAQVDRFQKDSSCRIFLGQMKAAGTGLDGLHKAASSVLFLEIGWTPAEHEQAEDRALRIGQNAKAVNIYYLIAINTVEEKILEMIETKCDICNKVLNGKSSNIFRLLPRRKK